MDVLSDIRLIQSAIRNRTPIAVEHYDVDRLKFIVFGSNQPSIFSLGGDLLLFHELISRRDRDGLTAYSKIATEAVIDHAINQDGVTSISLVQGAAMGGGFEAALAGNFLIAEKGVRLGFPEVLFGLFPGMGAYSLLRARVPANVAERMIVSARNFPSEELFEQGVIDHLAEPGQGENETRALVNRLANKPGIPAFRNAIRKYRSLDIQELRSVREEWVETALRLSDEHLRRIQKLTAAQSKFSTRSLLVPSVRYIRRK
jgi:DSF synthase